MNHILRGTPSNSNKDPLVNCLRKSKKTIEFENIVDKINKGYKQLVILRGLPGSGKSFLARKILEATIGLDVNYKLHIFSTDDYFCQNSSGTFIYDVTQIEKAHKWNQSRASQAISRGFSPVIIDNTNTQMWEMTPYVMMASEFGYQINILEPDTYWSFNNKELTKRNSHNVSRGKIFEMMKRYERHITVPELLSVCHVTPNQPQYRLYPPRHITVRAPVSETTQLANYSNENSEEMSENAFEQMMELSTDDDDSPEITTNEVPDVENLWGINHDTLRSWDIVTPIQDCAANSKSTEQLAVEHKVEMKDASVMTEDEYFSVLQGSEVILNDDQLLYLRVLKTYNRNINILEVNKMPPRKTVPSLDKSCMTDDLIENYDNHLMQLSNLFPAVPKTHLSYWYNKCKGDLEWTIEFLLEAKEEISSLMDIGFLEEKEIVSQPVSKDKINSDVQEMSSTTEKRVKGKKKLVENSDLKMLIESKINIGEDHYSKNLLRVKKSKFSDKSATGNSDILDIHQPSTSGYQKEKYTNDDEIIVIDSDMEMDELDIDDSGNKCNLSEKTIEINLGDHLVDQLEGQFGSLDHQYPKGLQPVIQIPISLARQLYTFYIESAYQQMDNQMQIINTLVREDEEFARKLQAQENEAFPSTKSTVPNFKEIMADQQAAQSLYQKEAENWKKLNPDDLAAKLTRQKLCASFPKVPEETLIEILYAHENKYQDTVETLIASMGTDNIGENIGSIKEPPINDVLLEEMKDAQKSNCIEEYNDIKEAKFYREEANKYLKRRSDYYQKAQHYHQRGMNEVAQFYSGLASSQTMHFDRANSLAATALLDEHSRRLQDFNTLDLHSLCVREAIPSLDVFLDRSINLLRLSNTKQAEYLQIITGRGKNSEGGIPKIRPAVQRRLRRRKIRYINLNPGLLKVKVTKTTWVTSEIPVS